VLNRKEIEVAVRTCLVKAGTTFRKDQIQAYGRAIQNESNPNARWVLERILENAKTAEKKSFPLCDDTGIPHLFVEVGDEVQLPRGWPQAINRGIAQGLQAMPGRPMAIKGNVIERIEQSKGLFKNPDKVLPGPVILKTIPGNKLAITVLLLGGGPEIRAKTYRIYHQRSLYSLLDEAISWITSEIQNLGCTPCVAAMGIGRSHTEAAALMLESMKDGSLSRQSRLEKKVTERINFVNIGPLGFGGNTTALGTFIKVGPQRASGVRIVSVRPCCCVEPRRATIVLSGSEKMMD
jgi:fumarate hydratase subunit alpha